MFLMWLGEQITERGIGNGISLIITAGIVSGIPSGIVRLLTLTEQGSMSMLMAVSIVIGILLLIYAVVYFESAQRKVPVHYAKRQFGSGMMPGQSIHMPFKLNMAGVIPPIFASSIILFPSTLLGWFGSIVRILFFIRLLRCCNMDSLCILYYLPQLSSSSAISILL